MDGLLIKNVSNDDSGDYICKAYQISDSISNIEEEMIQVKVRGGYLILVCHFNPKFSKFQVHQSH